MLTKERREPSVEIIAINAKLTSNENRIIAMEKELYANTKATKAIANNTAGLVSLTNDLEAGTKILCRLALGIKWLGTLIKDTYIPVCIVLVVFSAILHKDLPQWLQAMFKFLGA